MMEITALVFHSHSHSQAHTHTHTTQLTWQAKHWATRWQRRHWSSVKVMNTDYFLKSYKQQQAVSSCAML